MNLKSLENHIEATKSKLLELENTRKKYLLQIELNKKLTISSRKKFFEKIIEIITFGLISFEKKHHAIIDQIRSKITQINETIRLIDEEINSKSQEILDTKEKLSEEINKLITETRKFQDKLIKISMNTYINQYTQVKITNELNKIIDGNIKYLFQKSTSSSINEITKFIENPQRWINQKNSEFVINEKIKERHFFENIESKPLTEKQKDAILINENNNLILAGAGSGKTSVIVAKVAYLIKKNILQPNEILILAFNKNAQTELSERFKEKGLSIEIKTFHSFGLSVIAESTSQKPSLCPMTESSNNMTQFIKKTIDELMASASVFLENFTRFVAYFSIPYKSESEFTSLGEYYDHQKNYDMKTLKHEITSETEQKGKKTLTTLKEETVKSYQEFVIANFLTIHGIKYIYEEPYKHKTYTTQKRQYKPDFYLPEYDIYIEHFGIDRNNNTAPYINKEEYLESMKWKIEQHTKNSTTLIKTFSYEFNEKNIIELLKEKLLKHNVIFRKLQPSEISELLKQSNEDEKFTKLFTSFLAHYKSNMHSLEKLKEKSKAMDRTMLFLKLFEFIFNRYQKAQEEHKCIDFDDMIIKSLNIIKDGKYKHRFKHIFIDEFQDISTTRANLIKQLLLSREMSLTAVGDDWQSINRFAGSNIKIIQDFRSLYGVSQIITLDYTFRFDDQISEVASSFIQKNPYQIKKEISTIKKQAVNKFSILIFWNCNNIKQDLDEIIQKILKKKCENQIKILILARYNFLITSDLSEIIKKYSQIKIEFSTVHSSKGNEADYVIIINLDKGKFGFPSKIENDPILNIVTSEGDEFEDAEERRLFYVALTRTKNAVFLLSDRYNKSPFIDELIKDNNHNIYFLNNSKARILNCPECKTGILRKRIRSTDKNKHFYGCNNFPRCDYTENVKYCPECNSEVDKDENEKIARCSNNNCDFETILCVECGGYMIERNGKYGSFLGCENYPRCTNTSKIIENNNASFSNGI